MFHRGAQNPREEGPLNLSGWTSSDGHHFICKNPGQQNLAYHMFVPFLLTFAYG